MWVVVGVIAIIMMFGVIGTLFVSSQQEQARINVEHALDLLSAQCDRVCRLPDDTMLAVDVELPAGVVLESSQDVLCASFDGARSCRPCSCIYEDFVFDLDTPEAFEFFRSHTYRCFFTNNDFRMHVNCQG